MKVARGTWQHCGARKQSGALEQQGPVAACLLEGFGRALPPPALAEWLQLVLCQLLHSDSNFINNRSLLSRGILPACLTFNMEELPCKCDEDMVSSTFSSLGVIATSRAPCDVGRFKMVL